MLISYSPYTFIRWFVSMLQFMAKSQAFFDFIHYTWLKCVYVCVRVYMCQNGDDSATYFHVCSMNKQACCQKFNTQSAFCLSIVEVWAFQLSLCDCECVHGTFSRIFEIGFFRFIWKSRKKVFRTNCLII